jgi:hypothetical protein
MKSNRLLCFLAPKRLAPKPLPHRRHQQLTHETVAQKLRKNKISFNFRQ